MAKVDPEVLKLGQLNRQRIEETARWKASRAAEPLIAELPNAPGLSENELKAHDERVKNWRHRQQVYSCFAENGLSAFPKFYEANLDDLSRLPRDVVESYEIEAYRLRTLANKPCIIGVLGPRGVGKSYIGAAIVNSCCKAGTSAHFVELSYLICQIRECWRSTAIISENVMIERYVKPKVLIIDELDEKLSTDNEKSLLTRVVNRRYVHNRSTIMLSNLTFDAFKDAIGTSLASRMGEGGGVVYLDKWRDLRPEMSPKT